MLSTTRDGFRRARTFARSCRWLHTAAVLIAVGVMGLFAGIGQAGQERYDYDPIGRLIRFTDSTNEVTEYTYDKAGNILSVVRGAPGSNLPPVLTSVMPSVVRVGNTATLTLTGERLQVGTLQASDPGLDLVNVRQAATQVLADLTVSPSVPTGGHTLTFTNGQGTARIALTIAPKLPTISVEPSPLALPPDSSARSVTLRLSNPDVVAHQLSVTSSDTARMTVSPGTISFAPGQTTAQVSVTPKASGFVSLVLASATLKGTSTPVFITSDFRGVNTSYAAPLGVRVGEEVTPSAPSATATFKVNALGVAVGSVLTSMAPRGVAVGGTYTFTIDGAAIPADARVAVLRPDGVTVAGVSATAVRITATVTIDAGAAPGPRRMVVSDAAGNLLAFADPSTATFHVTPGQPQIFSMTPLFSTTGRILQLNVRGANLGGAQVRILPGVDLAIDNAPAVNADGSELSVRVAISPLAALGARTVQIITASGDTGSSATAANQFTIVNQIKEDVTPIFARAVGVQVGSSTPAEGTPTFGPLPGGSVGVLVGAAAVEVAPKVAVVGQSSQLVVQGSALQVVTEALIEPGTGITQGAFSVNPEGTTLTLPVTVDAGATRGMRRLVLKTASGKLVFMVPAGDQVLVATPAPELTWVKPQVVQAGKTTVMTLLGRNFNDITGVNFDPPAGLSVVGAVVPSEGGTVLTFSVQAAVDAPSGPRTVLVGTAGGTSSSVAAPSNTFQVARQIGPVLDSIFAVPLGVMVGNAPVGGSEALGIHAPNVGVVLTPPPEEVTEARGIFAPNVGVLVGPASTGLSPRSPGGLLKGTTGTLTVTGVGLGDVTSAAIVGQAGFSTGQVQANSDGTQLIVPVTVPPTASSTYQGLRLFIGSGATASRLTSLAETDMFFNVGSLPAAIASVSPIVLEQGKTYTFTVRGTNLADVYQLVAEPDAGLVFGEGGLRPEFSTDSFGEKLTVQVRVRADGAVGSRVVRFKVPGGITSAEPVPANTITIVTPQ